ncbi:hypothetical protein B0J18DRAFT_423511 [Chaetomium sp. MPI-SDFR-AT-0129]|nr:hypothetical protein B0J18DRAFT_423511 [Chaetomium sp. MPI-SDFR-AT-0129]
MATPLMARPPACTACLRRLAQPFGEANVVSRVQIRTKTNHPRPKDQGVVVRLLEDIPKFGRKDAIFRTERGRMRNEWFPKNMAEYMTALRFRELGLTRDNIGEREATFGTMLGAGEEDSSRSEAPTATVVTTTPVKARALLTTLIPDSLPFYRKPIAAPAPPPPPPARSISPLVATDEPNYPTSTVPDGPQAIFGSVSITDIINRIKGLLVEDVEGSLIALDPTSVRFLGLEEDTDRIKFLGRWEVEIHVGSTVEPVRKTVEILPLVEGPEDGEARSGAP